MNSGSSSGSNTVDLIAFINTMRGDTFAEKSAEAQKVLDARMSRVGQGSDEWKRLLRTKGLIGGFIRFDREIPLENEVSESALAA